MTWAKWDLIIPVWKPSCLLHATDEQSTQHNGLCCKAKPTNHRHPCTTMMPGAYGTPRGINQELQWESSAYYTPVACTISLWCAHVCGLGPGLKADPQLFSLATHVAFVVRSFSRVGAGCSVVDDCATLFGERRLQQTGTKRVMWQRHESDRVLVVIVITTLPLPAPSTEIYTKLCGKLQVLPSSSELGTFRWCHHDITSSCDHTASHLLHHVLCSDSFQHTLLASFHHFSAQKQIIQDEVCLKKNIVFNLCTSLMKKKKKKKEKGTQIYMCEPLKFLPLLAYRLHLSFFFFSPLKGTTLTTDQSIEITCRCSKSPLLDFAKFLEGAIKVTDLNIVIREKILRNLDRSLRNRIQANPHWYACRLSHLFEVKNDIQFTDLVKKKVKMALKKCKGKSRKRQRWTLVASTLELAALTVKRWREASAFQKVAS